MVNLVEQIKLNTNRELVNEVIDFLNSKCLLTPKVNITNSINSLDLAMNLAYETPDDEGYIWSDICEHKASQLYGKVYENPDSYKDFSDKQDVLLEQLNNCIQGQLDSIHSDLLDDAVDDFINIILSRRIHGKSNPFYESMFEVYKNGGWPCGIENDKIIAYSPKLPTA